MTLDEIRIVAVHVPNQIHNTHPSDRVDGPTQGGGLLKQRGGSVLRVSRSCLRVAEAPSRQDGRRRRVFGELSYGRYIGQYIGRCQHGYIICINHYVSIYYTSLPCILIVYLYRLMAAVVA